MRADRLPAAESPIGQPADPAILPLEMPRRSRPEEEPHFSRLPGGRHGLDPDVVAEHQRARILQAMTQLVAEQGFHAVTITGLCKRARVTERPFYDQFRNLEECFLAVYDSILEHYLGQVLEAYGAPLPWDGVLKGALNAILETTAEHPADAHLVLVDALTAGPRGIERNRELSGAFQAQFARQAADAPGPNAVPGIVLRGLVGGAREVIYNRVAAARTAELPSLLDPLSEWMLSYISYVPLDLSRARMRRPRPAEPRRKEPPPLAGRGYPHEYVRENQRQRLMDAVAQISREKGYGGLTLSGVARRARVSHQTFYEHFSNRDDAFLSTYRHDSEQAFAFSATAYLTHYQQDWPRAVHAGLARLLTWMAERPDHAHLAFIGFLATGASAYQVRHNAIQTFTTLLAPGYEHASRLPAIASEAIAGAIFEIISEEIHRERVERLPELLPLITYMTLTPFIGPEQAARIGREKPLAEAEAAGETV
jgi:AcrR family transcriptional regulator